MVESGGGIANVCKQEILSEEARDNQVQSWSMNDLQISCSYPSPM